MFYGTYANQFFSRLVVGELFNPNCLEHVGLFTLMILISYDLVIRLTIIINHLRKKFNGNNNKAIYKFLLLHIHEVYYYM